MLSLKDFKAVEIDAIYNIAGGRLHYTTLDGVVNGDAKDYENGDFYARNADGILVKDP